MNGKFLYLLMFCLNIVSIVLMAALPVNSPDAPQGSATNYVLSFYSFDAKAIINGTSSSISATSNLSNSTNAALTPATGVSQTGTLLGFIDVVRLVMALVSMILTPAPFFGLLIALGTPWIVVLVIGLPVSFLSVISIMEFLRGGGL